MTARILLLDIENAPHLVWVWSFFKTNVGAKQVVENGYMLSWAAKWLAEKEVFYQDKSEQSEKDMLIPLAKLLDEADIVITHNGVKFDIPHIQGRFLIHGINPPSPFKQVDTLQIAKKEFNFPSNSLEYLSIALDLPVKKLDHAKYNGFELWKAVLRDDKDAWKEMEIYNQHDVLALEALYLKFRPFHKQHPNVGVYDEGDSPVCPKCGSRHVQYRGYAHTAVSRFRRFQCLSCFGWGRVRTAEKAKAQGVNAL